MAISLATLRTGKDNKPPRILISGVQGVGKTTFAAAAPNPVFLFTEDGKGNLDLTDWAISSFDEMMEALTVLATEKHDFMTVVVDSADWFEPMVLQKVCQSQGVATIEAIPYGKGYTMALDYWREYLAALDYLRNEKNMVVIQTAHSHIKRYEAPDTDSYDRYMLKLNDKAANLLAEHSDCVFFTNYRTILKEDKNAPGKKGEKRVRAVGDGDRVLHTEERPAFHAKNRYSLPETIELNEKAWQVLAEHIPFLGSLTE